MTLSDRIRRAEGASEVDKAPRDQPPDRREVVRIPEWRRRELERLAASGGKLVAEKELGR